MLQFPVPQFIDVEDKIIGPFTLKQFGIVFGGGLIIVALFKILGSTFGLYLISIPLALITLYVAFGKFNGRRIYNTFPIILGFIISDRNYIFHKENYRGAINIKPITAAQIKTQSDTAHKPIEEGAPSRLKRISMLLDAKNQEELIALHLEHRSDPEQKIENKI